MIVSLITVGVGGFLGGASRYGLLQLLPHKVAILVGNYVATLILAVTSSVFMLNDDLLPLLLGVGYAGALSTWATFAVDVGNDLVAKRYTVAARDVTVTVAGCIAIATVTLHVL